MDYAFRGDRLFQTSVLFCRFDVTFRCIKTFQVQNLSILSSTDRISASDYSEIRSCGTSPVLLDTRPPHEFAIASLEEAKSTFILMAKLYHRLILNTLTTLRVVDFFCDYLCKLL